MMCQKHPFNGYSGTTPVCDGLNTRIEVDAIDRLVSESFSKPVSAYSEGVERINLMSWLMTMPLDEDRQDILFMGIISTLNGERARLSAKLLSAFENDTDVLESDKLGYRAGLAKAILIVRGMDQ